MIKNNSLKSTKTNTGKNTIIYDNEKKMLFPINFEHESQLNESFLKENGIVPHTIYSKLGFKKGGLWKGYFVYHY